MLKVLAIVAVSGFAFFHALEIALAGIGLR